MEMLYTAIQYIGILCLFILFLLFLWNLRPYSKEKVYKSSYWVKSSIFTKTEYKFYWALNKFFIMNNYHEDYTIFSKVWLIDIFYAKKSLLGKVDKKDIYRIMAKHIDFVVTDKTGRPILLIELDDPYHKWRTYYKSDELKNDISRVTGLPLVRFNASNSYSFWSVREILST